MKYRTPLIALAFACSTWLSILSADEHVFFAFDDYSIPWQHNLKVTLVPAQKYPGNPVLRSGSEGAPDQELAILYGTVIHDGGKFRMWYLGKPKLAPGKRPTGWRPMCYAESSDGIHWTKPDLGLVDFNGSKRNNICLIEGEPVSLTRITDFLSVLHDPSDPDPSRRYKTVYIAHVPYEDIRGGLSTIGRKEEAPCVTICATSADGLSWKIVGDRPADATGERFEVTSLYRFGNFYYSTGQLLSPWVWRNDGSDSGRVMMAYRSPDFVHWSQAKALAFARPGQLTNPPIAGQQTHMGAGLWNRNNALVGLYGMWQDGPKERPAGTGLLWGTHVDLGLIVSNDGIHFREPVPGFKVIARGGEGEWDNVALLQGHAFVNQGDQTMIWYSHWDTSGLKTAPMEIGLATLRRDGFGYLSVKEGDTEGYFITSLCKAGDSQSLLINAEGISAAHPLTIELLDESDRPIPGFSGVDGAVLSLPGTRQEITWPKNGRGLLPPNQSFAIKVTLPPTDAARVYAVYLTN